MPRMGLHLKAFVGIKKQHAGKEEEKPVRCVETLASFINQTWSGGDSGHRPRPERCWRNNKPRTMGHRPELWASNFGDEIG